MIDFDPKQGDVLMSQDVAMKFIIWAVYFKGLELDRGKSFARFEKFSPSDVERLDRLQVALFKCFEPESVKAASENLKKAKESGEVCPFPEEYLNSLFGN